MSRYLLSIYQPDGDAPVPAILDPGVWVFSAGLFPVSTATVRRGPRAGRPLAPHLHVLPPGARPAAQVAVTLRLLGGLSRTGPAGTGRWWTRGRRSSGPACDAVNAVRSDAPDAADMDRRRILALHDQLLAFTPSPMMELNRAVALAEVDGQR